MVKHKYRFLKPTWCTLLSATVSGGTSSTVFHTLQSRAVCLLSEMKTTVFIFKSCTLTWVKIPHGKSMHAS